VSGCEETDLSIFNKGVPMLKDFRDFISRGSVIDLAIGVIIGASFTAIVNSLVGDIFMPVVGALLGGVNFEGLAFQVGEASINYPGGDQFCPGCAGYFLYLARHRGGGERAWKEA